MHDALQQEDRELNFIVQIWSKIDEVTTPTATISPIMILFIVQASS